MVRVLLDEDVDVRLRRELMSDVEVETVAYRGWKGKKNGELLAAAAEHFDVFVTLDTNLRYQQNLSQCDLAVVVLRPRSQALEHLRELVPEVRRILSRLSSGKAGPRSALRTNDPAGLPPQSTAPNNAFTLRPLRGLALRRKRIDLRQTSSQGRQRL